MSTVVKISLERKREILGVLLLGFTALLFLTLVTDGYDGSNPKAVGQRPGRAECLGSSGSLRRPLPLRTRGRRRAHGLLCHVRVGRHASTPQTH